MDFWPCFCDLLQHPSVFLSSSQKPLPVSGCLCHFESVLTQRKGLYATCALGDQRSPVSKASQDWSTKNKSEKEQKNDNAEKQTEFKADSFAWEFPTFLSSGVGENKKQLTCSIHSHSETSNKTILEANWKWFDNLLSNSCNICGKRHRVLCPGQSSCSNSAQELPSPLPDPSSAPFKILGYRLPACLCLLQEVWST